MARKSRKAAATAAEVPVNGAARFQVGIYTRLSCEATANRESDSLLHQREMCLDYLKDKPDMALVDTYMDNGFTGTNFERGEFQRMLGDIRAKRINCVVVKDLSRFGRNYLEVDQYLNIRFPEWKVRFIAVLDHFDTAVPDKEGHLIVPFRNILNEYYSRDIARKMRSAFLARMKSGIYVGSKMNTPYGYIRDGENHTYQINHETAPVVQRLFQLRAEGCALYKIAATFNQEGIPCPTHYLYLKGMAPAERNKNALWVPITVRAISSNPVYLGTRIHHKHITGLKGSNRRPNPRDKQIWIENAHEALVSQEIFDTVQTINQQNRDNCLSRNSNLQIICDYRKGFRGRIFCGDCGKRITFRLSQSGKDKKVAYTRCHQYLTFRDACTIHSISMPKLVAIVEQALKQQTTLVDVVEDSFKSINGSDDGKLVLLKRRMRSLSVQKNNVFERKNQLLKDYLSGILNRDEYFLLKGQYEAQITQLEEECAGIQKKITEVQIQTENAQKWVQSLRRFGQHQTITNELIQDLVERVDLYQNGKTVDVKLIFRFQDTFQQVLEEVSSYE